MGNETIQDTSFFNETTRKTGGKKNWKNRGKNTKNKKKQEKNTEKNRKLQEIQKWDFDEQKRCIVPPLVYTTVKYLRHNIRPKPGAEQLVVVVDTNL